MTRPLRVLFVSPEVAPFAKTGGLADVAGALPKALVMRGLDVRVVMPLYAGIPWSELERLDGPLVVPTWWGQARSAVRMSHLPGSAVPVYFLEFNRYFDRPFLYGPSGDAYSDNLERFAFLSRGALELARAIGFEPDVVHANDWQTALLPVYVNTVERGRPLHACASVYTIHNLAYQGVGDPGALFITGLGREHLHPGELEHFGTMNLTKAALAHSTMLSTVSPTYAREVQTQAFGFGLDGVLRARAADLRGILNGIDTEEWNPATDHHLAAPFSVSTMRGKAACKAALQKEAGFPLRPEVPVYAAIGRLTEQKGFDVLAHALEPMLAWDIQMVLLGSGDLEAESFFAAMSARRPEKFRAWIGFDDARAHRIEAGADIFIMPSRFEPCGLNQMYSLRYGTLPIVRATGGLVDTVASYDEATGAGTGFVFHDLTPEALANTVGWSLSTYTNRREHFTAMRKRAMAQDFSWERAAGAYERIYLEAYRRRRGQDF